MKVHCTGKRRDGKDCGYEWTTRLETGDIPKKCARCGQHTVKRGKQPQKAKKDKAESDTN